MDLPKVTQSQDVTPEFVLGAQSLSAPALLTPVMPLTLVCQ